MHHGTGLRRGQNDPAAHILAGVIAGCGAVTDVDELCHDSGALAVLGERNGEGVPVRPTNDTLLVAGRIIAQLPHA
jgi:hypothetical protein